MAVAAGLCAFGLAEETLSSGRSPASNNGLVTYVPSRGLISLRGNWPLMALRDQPAPYARTMDDLLHLLDVLVRDDDRDPAGGFDLWRDQDAVALPRPSAVRPRSFLGLADREALSGVTIGVPRLYVGKDTTVAEPCVLTPAVQRLWSRAEEDLRALGATVVEVDPPVFRLFDDLKEAATLEALGYWPEGFAAHEWVRLIASTWDAFLRDNADPALPSLGAVGDVSSIFPEEFHGLGPEVNPMGRYDYAGMAAEAAAGITPVWEIAGIAEAIAGLERFRREHLEAWMRDEGIGLLAFPAHTGAGPAAADRDPAAARAAWKPGVNYALGGTAMRALGIPAVVVPMGLMEDCGMPVGITFAAAAYEDRALLAAAYAYEHATGHRTDPLHAPVGPHERRHRPPSGGGRPVTASHDPDAGLRVDVVHDDGEVVRLAVEIDAARPVRSLRITVDGVPVPGARGVTGRQELEIERPSRGPRTTADGPQAGLVVAVAGLDGGTQLGAFAELDRPRRYEAPAGGAGPPQTGH